MGAANVAAAYMGAANLAAAYIGSRSTTMAAAKYIMATTAGQWPKIILQ